MKLTKWCCESCGSPLPIPGSGFVTCESCGMVYHVDGYENPHAGIYTYESCGNVGVGYNADNVFIGHEAGWSIGSGEYSVMIGTTSITYE